jgi:drug/metabolite transporter superfamily protein YnfA
VPRSGPMPTRLIEMRVQIAEELAAHIALCVARRDSPHAAFHGCIDWHSAVHGVWALVAYARMTGSGRHGALVADILDPERLATERALLRTSPGFEMPYGRAWFLRLAREHAGACGSDALRPMAEEVLASMLAHYAGRPPEPRRGGYESDSWALLNMHDYAVWSGNAAALETVRGWVGAHFLDAEGGCDYAAEAGHFMAVSTSWAWLVSKVLEREVFDRWAEAFFAPGLPCPVAAPSTWHHHGLNFSRAWGLYALSLVSGSERARRAFLDAYAAHFRATYEAPKLWRGSYQGVGHWVPQFGMLALQPLFEM